MEVISKQIEAQARPSERKMSKYEYSLALLASAQNLIDQNTDEYLLMQVEVGKNKRLIAV